MPRRRVLVVAALAVAALAGAATPFALPGDDGTTTLTAAPGTAAEPYGTSPRATGTPTGTPTPAEPAPEPTATAVTTPSRPGGAPEGTARPPAPDPSTEPAAPPTANPGPKEWTSYGPRAEDSVTVPYEKGRRSWDVTADGIRFVVSVTPAKVGQETVWTVESSTAENGCCSLHLQYGDGFAHGDTGCRDFTAASTFRHTYNKPGVVEILLEATTRERCKDPEGRHSSVYLPFDVAPGKQTAQGPTMPRVEVLDVSTRPEGHEADRTWLSLFVEARDEDGWLRRIEVDWGDGTTETFAGDPHECQRTPSGWPAESRAWLPHDPPPPHHYASGGTYVIQVTVRSTACDGTEAQTGTRSMTYDAG